MRKARLLRSLRFKVTAGVLLPLLVILSVLAYVRHRSYQDLLMNDLQASAANAGEIIEGSLQHAMLTNDFSTVEQIVHNIEEQPMVRALLLLDKSGLVLISTDVEMVGKTMHADDVTCQACHRHEAATRNENVILAFEPSEDRVFRNVNAIENAPECQTCHGARDAILGVLITDLDIAPIENALAIDRQRSLLWSAGSILLVTVIVDLLMSRMVIGRLVHLTPAIKRIRQGDLDVSVESGSGDEIGELGRAFNQMIDGLRDKERLEQSLKEQTKRLQSQAEKLSTLNTLAATVSQSLNLEETLEGALDKVLELMRLKAGWTVLQSDGDPGRELDLAISRGLPEDVASAHVRCTWNQGICSEVLDLGHSKIVHGLSEDAHLCPSAAYLQQEGLVFRICIPLTAKDRVLGVMSLVGDASDGAQVVAEDTVEMLEAIGREIGIAVENARLYEDLRQEEMLRRRLLERIISVQEEERKRIALELHDQTGQSLTSLIMTLSILSEAESLAEIRAHIQDLRDTAAQVLREVHDLALELRPRVLDDLGLLPALRHLHKGYQDRFQVPIDLQVVGLDLDEERLPPDVETTLYRIVQEALTNVVRHAQAGSVSVLLEKRGTCVVLIVEDDGRGFDVTSTMDPRALEEKLGLYGMRERASLLNGTLTVESTPEMGTTLFVEIPLEGRTCGD